MVTKLPTEPLFPEDWKPKLELQTNILDHNIGINTGVGLTETTSVGIFNTETDQSYVAISTNILDSIAINPEHLIDFN